MDEYWNRELAIFEESPISLKNLCQRESFRLVIARPSFIGPCLCVRMSVSNDYQASHTTAKQLKPDGQLDVVRDVSGELSIVMGVRNHFDSVGFWSWPKHDSAGGIDGATWTIEGASYGRYNRVVRWEPNDLTFLALASDLASLCGCALECNTMRPP